MGKRRRPLLQGNWTIDESFAIANAAAFSRSFDESAIIGGLGTGQALPALFDGGGSSVGRVPGCDPGRRGFESHPSPQNSIGYHRGKHMTFVRGVEHHGQHFHGAIGGCGRDLARLGALLRGAAADLFGCLGLD